jgi:hypothetical protein
MSKVLDPDTYKTVSDMVRYIGCDRKIAAYVAITPDEVARVRRGIKGLRGRPKSLKPYARESGGAGEDYRIIAKPDAERGSAALAERIHALIGRAA